MNSTFLLDQFIGRFHPVLVHLPIGFLLLLAALELLALRPAYKHLSGASRAILILSVPVTLGAALTGWLLAGGSEYQSELLFQHRWAGVGVAALSVLLLIVHQRHKVRLYRALLAVMVLLLAFTGHQGGSLTHGSDYLGKHAPSPLRAFLGAKPGVNSPADSVFSLAVLPVIERNCISCHGAEKTKGGLRLDSLEHMIQGGDNGPAIIIGSGEDSEIIVRARLPLDDDDHMPPEGKPQPTLEEIVLLAWWIDAGASLDKTAKELNPPPHIEDLLNRR